MRIALVVPGGVDRSGQYRVVPALLALVERLAARHEVHVFALRQEAEPGEWMLLGAHVHNVGGRVGVLCEGRAIAAILCVHRACPFDVVQAIWSGPCGAVAVVAGRLASIPSLVHVAGGELVAFPSIGYGGLLNWRGRLRERLVRRGAAVVTAASAPILAQLAALGRAGLRVPLGVDLWRWPPRPPQRRDPHSPLRLIHVASLNEVKDQATLLRAMALLAGDGVDFHLDIVGEDTLGGRVQALARSLRLETRTRFHGFLTQARVRPLLEAAHIHVVASLHEAGPLALLEAAVLGVPTAGTAVGHLVEWAPHAALAVPPADAPALAAAIRRLAADEDLRLQLAGEAWRRAVGENADHTAALFEELHAASTGR